MIQSPRILREWLASVLTEPQLMCLNRNGCSGLSDSNAGWDFRSYPTKQISYSSDLTYLQFASEKRVGCSSPYPVLPLSFSIKRNSKLSHSPPMNPRDDAHLWCRWASICVAGILNSSGAQDTWYCDHPASSQAGEYLPLINLIVREAYGHKSIPVLCEVFISVLNLYKFLHPSTQDESSITAHLSCTLLFPTSFSLQVLIAKPLRPPNTKTDMFVEEPELHHT